MEGTREDGRSATHLRQFSCSRGVLHRAHGSASWSQGQTKVLAAVYGPKAGTPKNENPEKACFEVIWKPHTGQVGNSEKECEMILKKTIQSICVLTMNPNTTTSVIIQVVQDDGSLLVAAINAACAALLDAGIPMKFLAVGVCCCVSDGENVILDPTNSEEKKSIGLANLAFFNSKNCVVPKDTLNDNDEPKETGIISSCTRGVMSVDEYLHCLDIGRAAAVSLSKFLNNSLQSDFL